jgi:hypothetical protein
MDDKFSVKMTLTSYGQTIPIEMVLLAASADDARRKVMEEIDMTAYFNQFAEKGATMEIVGVEVVND